MARRLPAWLYKVARCTALSHWRGYYRSQARLDGYAAAADHRDETAVSGDVDRFDDAEQVRITGGVAPEKQEQVIPQGWFEKWVEATLASRAQVTAGDVSLGPVAPSALPVPIPVVMPHPSRHTFSSGASERMTARAISGTTVYSAKVDVPM